ncbi:Transposase IS4 [Fragilaria crotonensis]|nr:Transposase IS4 [Fragilaria crotonensis]
MDRQRRYFISTASSLDAGAPYARLRWRQLDDSPNAEPTRMELTVPQPKAAEIYYDACAMVDRHNRHRQQTLGLELKLGTHIWAMRVNLSIFSMIVVDTWLVYSQPVHRYTGKAERILHLALRGSLTIHMTMCIIAAAEGWKSKIRVPGVQNYSIEPPEIQGQELQLISHLQKEEDCARWFRASIFSAGTL